MSIAATNPTTIDAVYNLWAIASLTVSGDGCVAFGQQPNPGQSAPTPGLVSVTAKLVKYRVLPSGLDERSPSPADVVQLSIPDVYGYIATGTPQAVAVAEAMASILTALQAYGTQQGIL